MNPKDDNWIIRAEKLQKDGKMRDAFAVTRDAALAGDPGAQTNLGYYFDTGQGVKRNLAKALYWYKLSWRVSADTGNLINIGLLYAGKGNLRRAFHWMERASGLGDGDASLELARLILKHRSNTSHNLDKARELLEKVRRSRHVSEYAKEDAAALLKQLKSK